MRKEGEKGTAEMSMIMNVVVNHYYMIIWKSLQSVVFKDTSGDA